MSDITDDLYHETLLEAAKSLTYYGEMTNPDLVVIGSNASCGDVVKIYAQLENPEDPNSKISKISWIGSGCLISRAGTNVVARLVIEQSLTLSQASILSQALLEQELGLENVSINRVKCLLLAVTTLKQKS